MTTEIGNILVVDDNRVNRMLLTRALADQGHQSAIAENGRRALELLRAEGKPAFDVVLLDLLMPEMDGYETLAQIKGDEALRHLPVIMISAVDEMDSIILCIEKGAEDYLPIPFNSVLLRARVSACLEKKRLRDDEQLYLKSLERELEIGREIQSSFLPETLPAVSGWEIAVRFKAARQVAGDFYDLFTLGPEGRLAVIIADVCDKGVGAALFMALCRSLLRSLALQEYSKPSPDRSADSLRAVVEHTNDYIADNHGQANMFTTLFFGVLDPASGSLRYINGGHEPPLILSGGKVKTQLELTGLPLGMMPAFSYKVGETVLMHGDTLLALTDGVTEASNEDREFITTEHLLGFLQRPITSAAALLDQIEADVVAHMAGASPADDMTMLALRRAAQ